MIYNVGEMAQKLGVPASTLRYYDKEGLLPFVERSSGGIRMFRENDFEWLQVIRCMKKAGMSIKDIRQYIELSMQGDDTIDTRLEMFRHQREVLTQQIQQLQHTLETVEYKCWFYEAAKAAGTVDVPGAMTDADVPEQFRAIRQELRGQKMPNPGYSGAAECSPVCHQAAGYHRPVHLGKPQDRLALQPHPFPRCVPQISGRSGRCPLAHTAQLPPHLCVADAGVGRGHPDHPEHRRPCRHRDD